MTVKNNDEPIEERESDEAEEADALGIYSEPLEGGIMARIYYAKKAVVAAVAAIATLALALGVGDEETWAQIAAVVVAVFGVLGVFYATNED